MLNDNFKKNYKLIPIASDTGPDLYGTELHNHMEFEILLITGGTAEVIVCDKKYTAKKDDMFFINPLEIHSIKNIQSQPYSRACLCFDASLISDNDVADNLKKELLHINHHIKSDNENQPVLKSCFLGALSSLSKRSKYYDMEIKAYISLMFANILKNDLIYPHSAKSKNSIFCSDVLQYISEHYSEHITSKTAAAALSYNQSYFCRIFHKSFGKSFSDYLNVYRISQSRHILETTGHNITQTAYLCGFNSHSYFSKAFKKHFGIIPSKYKKVR